jgi:hypothetical protein
MLRQNKINTRNTSTGFVLFELMLGVGILSIFSIAVMLFVTTNTTLFNKLDIVRQIFNNAQIAKSIVIPNQYTFVTGSLNQCDAWFQNINNRIHDIEGGEFFSGSLDLTPILKIDSISSEALHVGRDNIITKMQFHNGLMYLSLDSSSTTDPDIALMDMEQFYNSTKYLIQNALDIFDDFVIFIQNTGPGIVDFVISGTDWFLGNTGAHSSLQVFSVLNRGLNIVQKLDCAVRANQNDGHKIKTITEYAENLILGYEKNDDAELYVVQESDCAVLQKIETGFGINKLFSVENWLFVLGPSDPELVLYINQYENKDQAKNQPKDQASADTLYPSASYDAPGLSGNGRSFDWWANRALFGRSKGNNELSLLNVIQIESSTTISSSAEFKIQASADALVLGDTYALVLTSNLQKTLELFTVTASGFNEIAHLALPTRTHQIACYGDYLFIAGDATSTSLFLLR